REDAIGREPVDALAHESDGAGPGRERARDQVEERRLAGAVGADETGDGARVDRQIDAVDGAQTAERFHEPRDLEHEARLWQSPRGGVGAPVGGRGAPTRYLLIRSVARMPSPLVVVLVVPSLPIQRQRRVEPDHDELVVVRLARRAPRAEWVVVVVEDADG